MTPYAETLKKRQEKEFRRLVEGEGKMVALQHKLQKAQEEERQRSNLVVQVCVRAAPGLA